MDARQCALQEWLKLELGLAEVVLNPIVGDASFRRYFRFYNQDQSYVIMDAPPALEPCLPFVKIAKAFYEQGLNVPYIYKADIQQGFLMLSDFGNQLYVNVLNHRNANRLYCDAIDQLFVIQRCDPLPDYVLDNFNTDCLQEELSFFSEWFLKRFLNLELSAETSSLLEETYQRLHQNACEQPQICIHRDYHSRNLMYLENQSLGILDFQDAMMGPITYDLVSLIRDCYIDWPLENVQQWAEYYYDSAVRLERLDVSFETFLKWFDLMGMQRHLKAIFIFARKSLRDQNHHYLKDIPRALKYVQFVSKKYPELQSFDSFLDRNILPRYTQKQIEAGHKL